MQSSKLHKHVISDAGNRGKVIDHSVIRLDHWQPYSILR